MRDGQVGGIGDGGNSMGKGRAVEKYVPNNASPTIPAQRALGRAPNAPIQKLKRKMIKM